MLDDGKVEKVFAKYDQKKTGTVATKQLSTATRYPVYVLRDLRIVVTPEERRSIIEQADPTKKGVFDLQGLKHVVEQKKRSINPEEELRNIFRIYDEGKR